MSDPATVIEGSVNFRGNPLPALTIGGSVDLGFLHGPLGNEGLPPVAAALAERGYGVGMPSLPGFANPYQREDLRNLHDWVVALSDVLDEAGLIGKPFLAESVGAMLALELAAIRPEAFSSLILVAPLGLWDEGDPVADVYASLSGKERAFFSAKTDSLARFFESCEGLSAEALVAQSVQRHVTRATSASILWQIPEFGFVDRAYRVRVPVTLIWGEQDAVVSPAYMERFAAILPNVVGQHRVVEAGHLATYDAPDAVADIVARSLAGTTSDRKVQ